MNETEQDDFFKLLAAYQQGALNERETQDLERVLAADREARRLFIDFQQRSAAIAEDFRRQLISEQAAKEAIASSDAEPVESEASIRKRVSTPKFLVLLTLAASLLVMFRFLGQPEDRMRLAVAPDVPVATFATLTYADNAEWLSDQGEVPRMGQTLHRGSVYHLVSGAARLRMDSGAIVAIASPSTFSGSGGDALNLRHGKITARMPDQDSDLSVRVGETLIRDLGTAFGITTRDGGDFDLSVFDGCVAVQARDRQGNLSELELMEGHSAASVGSSLDERDTLLDVRSYEDIWPLTIGIDDASSMIELARPGPQQPLSDLANNSRLLLVPEQLNQHIQQSFQTNLLLPGASWPEAMTTRRSLFAGQVISSYLLAYVPEVDADVIRPRISGRVSFQKPILGVVIEGEALLESDQVFGIDEINYEEMTWRRLEVNWTDDGQVAPDAIHISGDGKTLYFDLHVNVTGHDSIRVLVDERELL
ncbi:MAG: hypothetical protein AAGD07_22665 [Planctomycetota bacterium]